MNSLIQLGQEKEYVYLIILYLVPALYLSTFIHNHSFPHILPLANSGCCRHRHDVILRFFRTFERHVQLERQGKRTHQTQRNGIHDGLLYFAFAG